jgi:hypothetical protein
MNQQAARAQQQKYPDRYPSQALSSDWGSESWAQEEEDRSKLERTEKCMRE